MLDKVTNPVVHMGQINDQMARDSFEVLKACGYDCRSCEKSVSEMPDVLFSPLSLVGKCSDMGTEHWWLTMITQYYLT